MKNTKTVKVKAEKIISITCDSCKTEYSQETSEGMMEIQEFFHIDYTGGYGSIIEDMASIEADICQHCVVKHLGHALRIESYQF